MNIKKSIRGGAGSIYKKGPNMTMDMGKGSPGMGGEKWCVVRIDKGYVFNDQNELC